MDPQSTVFTPQPDVWRLSNSMRTLQDTQQDHAQRLKKLERVQYHDPPTRGAWGSLSPFPSVLSGLSQTGPTTRNSETDFTNFDDDTQSNHMIRSLNLDADDEPRRLGAVSRANSVRFDESANQAQWVHASRTSIDLFPRASPALPGLGGHPMFERTTSHKSDGRQSSAGHSASGRANSFGLEIAHPLSQPTAEPPGLAPGLLILGAVPSIIRCWLSTEFKHDTLLYAAICTGSYKSFLDIRLIEKLSVSHQIHEDLSGVRRIKLPVYLPEGVPHMSSARSNSPAPQLPCLVVEFTVIDRIVEQDSAKAIQIFLGSDTLRAHNADVMFSSNTLNLFDEERNKLSVPLVRPENAETFKCLHTRSGDPMASAREPNRFSQDADIVGRSMNNLEHGQQSKDLILSGSIDEGSDPDVARPQSPLYDEKRQKLALQPRDNSIARSGESDDYENRAPLGKIDTSKADVRDGSEESPSVVSSSRSGPQSAIWSNWRRDGPASAKENEWASTTRNGSASYARPNRDQGIKVLKPIRLAARSSLPGSSASSTVAGQSRYFDDGRHRDTNDTGDDQEQQQVMSPLAGGKETTKSRGTNPIGGASAFGWLNGQAK